MRDSVTLHLPHPPERVWGLLADVTRIGELSPETFEAEWLDGASGPAVGAKFRGHVKRNGIGPIYWTTCKVTKCEPGAAFEFGVLTGSSVTNTWGYTFAATDGGTDATEYFRLSPSPVLKLYWAMLGWARGRTNREGMTQTLNRLKAIAESS